jgi:hypothetical protein
LIFGPGRWENDKRLNELRALGQDVKPQWLIAGFRELKGTLFCRIPRSGSEGLELSVAVHLGNAISAPDRIVNHSRRFVHFDRTV